MRKLTIYIARHRHSTKHSAHSEPCSHCAREIKRIGIKKIVYVNEIGEINKSLSDKYHCDYICPVIKSMKNKVLR